MADSANTTPVIRVDRESYPFRLGQAVALLRSLVDPADYTDIEATRARARDFLGIENEHEAQFEAWLDARRVPRDAEERRGRERV